MASSSAPRVMVSATAAPVLLIRRKISEPADTPGTARASEPLRIPAKPSWRRTKAPSPSVSCPPLPLTSTAAVTEEAARINSPFDFSKKKFPPNSAADPEAVRPAKVSVASSTETRTKGPAGRSSWIAPPSKGATRLTAEARVLISTLMVPEETETPGTLKTAEPTVRIPSVPFGSVMRLPLAPEMATSVEPFAVRKRLAEITSMTSPPFSRVSKEKPPCSDCSPTMSWALTPITFTTGPARIWIDRVMSRTVTVSFTGVERLLTSTRKFPEAEILGSKTESDPDTSKAAPSEVETMAPVASSIWR